MNDTAFMTSSELLNLGQKITSHDAKILNKKYQILSDPSEMEDLLTDNIGQLVSSIIFLVHADSAEGGYQLKQEILNLAMRHAEILVGPMEE